MVDKLVSVNAVQRQESPKDRRIKMIQLTDSGLGLRDELLEAIAALPMPHFEKLSTDERQTLVRLLGKLAG